MAATGKSGTTDGARVQDTFYLPDLCTVQSLLFIVLVGALLSIVFTLASGELRNFNWYKFSLISFFVLWVVLLSVAALCRLRPYLTRMSLLKGSLFSYGLIVLVTLSVSFVSQWIEVNFLGQSGFDAALVVEHVMIAAILAGVSLRYLYLQEQLHIQQQAELASRIQALQSRIRPHFLFNSMNIIASLIETEPALAEQVVEDLSGLFRASLSDANQLVPISQEIDLVKKYIHIESLRLGERLKVDWQVDTFASEELIPHLSIQPLIENSIYHGIQPLASGGTITILVRHEDGRIHVLVRNPVPEQAAQDRDHRGNSLALENLQRRLTAYYGNRAQFSAGKKGALFEVEFTYPVAASAAEKV